MKLSQPQLTESTVSCLDPISLRITRHSNVKGKTLADSRWIHRVLIRLCSFAVRYLSCWHSHLVVAFCRKYYRQMKTQTCTQRRTFKSVAGFGSIVRLFLDKSHHSNRAYPDDVLESKVGNMTNPRLHTDYYSTY